MTTIAFDGVTMAADRQQCGRYKFLCLEPKIFRMKGSIFGTAGNVEDKIILREWLSGKGDKPEIVDSFAALEATPNGLYYWSSEKAKFRFPLPAAIGTGAEYAMGAMLQGATAREAVAIAIRLDEATGFGIQTMKAP